jgi:hypothetical protein
MKGPGEIPGSFLVFYKAILLHITRRTKMKKMVMIAGAILASFGLAGCLSDADQASINLSKAAEMFEIDRKIVFYNGITDEYVAVIEGKCSVEPQARTLEVTCKEGPQKFSKHFLGLSDNVTFFALQTEAADVSVYHTRIIFKPQSILFDADINVSTQELTTDLN